MGKRWHKKSGLCGRYETPKTRYAARAIAEFDAQCLRAAHPGLTFNVFRCSCGAWHVGKPVG